jgi:glycosyltransferase involved in cell wall biosynthesis
VPDVLQVITSSARRGAERFAIALEGELAARGLDVSTVALVPGGQGALPVRALGSQRLSLSTLRALRKEMAAARATIAHGSTTLPACIVAGAGLGRPMIYRNIGDPAYWGASLRRRTQTRVLLRRATLVVALTDTTRTRLIGMYDLDPARVIVMSRGVSEEEFPHRTPESRRAGRNSLGVEDAVPVALYVGSLTPEKDLLTAVRAVGVLLDWHLVVAGEGPDGAEAERLARQLAPGRVHLLGPVEEPATLMAAADVLVVPSRTEGLAGVAIEASLVGIPTVATAVGFMDEIVEDRVTGRLVPVGDHRALADALVEVAPRSHEMGEAAYRHARDRFALSVVADRWYAAVRAVLDGRVPGSHPAN